MTSFPSNKITGLGLLKNDLQSVLTPKEYIYLDISLFEYNPTLYAQFLFQDKIIILAEPPAAPTNFGIPAPANFPRPDGYKIRLMANFTIGWSSSGPGSTFYAIYSLDDSNNYITIIQNLWCQTYLTLIWSEADQIWYPIRDLLEPNAVVTIARPLPPSTDTPVTDMPVTEITRGDLPY
jgi:hypothetical protein